MLCSEGRARTMRQQRPGMTNHAPVASDIGSHKRAKAWQWWFAFCCVLLTLGMAACSGQSAQPPVVPASRAPVAWADWRPREPVRDLKALAESDKLALRERQLAEVARAGRITEVPKVALERWIHPTEVGAVAEECFAEAGFEVRSVANGEGFDVVSQVSGDQGKVLSLAHYVCTARFFVDPYYMQLPTRDQIRVTYEYYIEVLSPCLGGQGYEVPEPPSLETFIAQHWTPEEWTPYKAAGIDSQEPGIYELLYEGTCRSGPPPGARYGE